ncbi:MAG: methionine adenosyltransferase [Euryarchaeota archaeon]|jgi:S-adenosylmethionine synthetase|nr:methionine adenosyltransferase [Euryarchaeota archaeon]MBT5593012.1 methionine adenosyltransferase [Euryarchaeota archaeon]
MQQDIFTSESVTSGHPDKLCDAISDAIVDACLALDSNARVAVETCVKGMDDKSVIILAGEVSLDAPAPNYETIARQAAANIGYNSHDIGMDATNPDLCDVLVYVTTQSAYINQGVDRQTLDSQGAGDQGLMFGFACTETEQYEELKGRYFPLSAALSQRLSRRLTTVREENILPWARPDGKSQVSVGYNDQGEIIGVDTVIVAIQHDKHLKDQFEGSVEQELEHVREQIKKHVVEYAIPSELLTSEYTLIVNGTGRFADPGGPYADAGLTGRKIIVDTYGGMGRHGGGAFSGKDPSKVDRSAAYAARWAAKHVVAAGLASRFEIQLAYVIGVAKPVSLMVDSFGTGVVSDSELARRVQQTFDFRPAAIAKDLDLLRPIYKATAAGGHFGRHATDDGHFPWERLDASRLEKLGNF